MRQHKLDINLIYDVDPAQFLENIDLFVEELADIDFINLFINALVDAERSKELDFMFPQTQEQLLEKQHKEFMAQFEVKSALKT